MEQRVVAEAVRAALPEGMGAGMPGNIAVGEAVVAGTVGVVGIEPGIAEPFGETPATPTAPAAPLGFIAVASETGGAVAAPADVTGETELSVVVATGAVGGTLAAGAVEATSADALLPVN